jgi:hypothetical protein
MTEVTTNAVPDGEPIGFVLEFKEDIKVGIWFDFQGDISEFFTGEGTQTEAENLFVAGVADAVRRELRA